MQRVSVFMSVFDCHVNRAPITGRISRIAYRPGLFVNADLDKASEDNERNGLVIEAPQGRFGVVQIAGLVARRIVSFVQEGESIGVGDRFRAYPLRLARGCLYAHLCAAHRGDRLARDRRRNRARRSHGSYASAVLQGRLTDGLTSESRMKRPA